jgi:pyruvate formate lyase activating enzyme
MDFTHAEFCVTHALKMCGEWRSAEEILETIMPDKPFYENSGGGVTVTGGEPLAQADFSKHLLSLCKQAGIHTAIETCGYGDQRLLLEIAELCGLIFYDIKIIDAALHEQYTGVNNEVILNNLAALCNVPGNSDKITIRVPCIPEMTDSPKQIYEIAQLAVRYGIRRIEPMPYNEFAGAKYEWLRRKYELTGLKARPKDYYDKLSKIKA